MLVGNWDELMSEPPASGLIEAPKVLPANYRVATPGAKTARNVAWQVVEFLPHAKQLSHSVSTRSRFVALQRVHRRSSGILELATHIPRLCRGPNEAVQPHFYTSFSASKNVETKIEEDKEQTDSFLSGIQAV